MINNTAKPVIAVGGVLMEKNRVLLIKRGRFPAKHQWAIPGGKIRFCEKLKDAVRREYREETGLDVEPGEVIYVFDAIGRDDLGENPYHYVIIDFIVHLKGGHLKAGDDALEAKWFSREELDFYDIAPATREFLLTNPRLHQAMTKPPKGSD